MTAHNVVDIRRIGGAEKIHVAEPWPFEEKSTAGYLENSGGFFMDAVDVEEEAAEHSEDGPVPWNPFFAAESAEKEKENYC